MTSLCFEEEETFPGSGRWQVAAHFHGGEQRGGGGAHWNLTELLGATWSKRTFLFFQLKLRGNQILLQGRVK